MGIKTNLESYMACMDNISWCNELCVKPISKVSLTLDQETMKL
jgi:hypothetical protein